MSATMQGRAARGQHASRASACGPTSNQPPPPSLARQQDKPTVSSSSRSSGRHMPSSQCATRNEHDIACGIPKLQLRLSLATGVPPWHPQQHATHTSVALVLVLLCGV